MGVARPGLWAPVSAFSIFVVRHLVMEAVRQTKNLLINLDKSIVDEGFTDLALVVQKLDSPIHRQINIKWISIRETNYAIQWIEIYPMDSVIQHF